MDKEKQIEEIKSVLIRTCKRIRTYEEDYMQSQYAKALYNAGYRKERVGEWIDSHPNSPVYKFTCSLCKEIKLGKQTPYCLHCGARMKGAD